MMALPVVAGTISGKVRAEGKAGADQDANCGKYDSRALKFAEKVNYDEMRDFVVYIEGPVGTNKLVVPDKPVQVITKKKDSINKEVKQKGAMFSPHILPIVVGTTVEWPNNDEIYHNVFSYSEAKPFDLGLYKSGESKSIIFDVKGRVDVFCSIHSTMGCVVMVLENPYYATTNDKNLYSISNVPPGTYKLKAWHERLPSQIKEITVPENGEVKVDFTLGITNLPKY
ncbi:MAG: hypothetical protein JWQ71_4377 [Pedosphaera sp.]|nr:hypothetical protein [Pedosphaera sp.]